TELEGDDHIFFFGGREAMLESVRWVIDQERIPVEEDRFLSTALVVDAPADADRSVWQERVSHFKGRIVTGTWRAYFDGPIRALRCGAEVAEALDARCGVHTGEVVRVGADASGPAFDVAARLARDASAAELRASRIVVDLVPGSDLAFRPAEASITIGDRET
ncbi:MAG: hypothetical protein AAF997_20035, partial [Myxococcota bacterium]